MAKEVFAEYAAFDSRGGIRFMHKGKMISENAVPPEVVELLKHKIATQKEPEAPKFPRPTPEQIAQLKAESLQVPEHLRLTPEEEATRFVPDNEAPLTPDDFDEPVDVPPVEEPVNLVPPEDLTPQRKEPTTAQKEATSDFLEQVSIHTAPLADMVQALYERFGIYTVWLEQMPEGDETNPLTGEQFTKYHLGIAYQAKIQARHRGLSDPSQSQKAMVQSRAAHENFQDQFEPIAHTLGEARAQDNFNYRTSPHGTRSVAATEIQHVLGEDGKMHAVQVPVPLSEHGGVAQSRFDPKEEEQIVEPPIFGNKQIIKPDW